MHLYCLDWAPYYNQLLISTFVPIESKPFWSSSAMKFSKIYFVLLKHLKMLTRIFGGKAGICLEIILWEAMQCILFVSSSIWCKKYGVSGNSYLEKVGNTFTCSFNCFSVIHMCRKYRALHVSLTKKLKPSNNSWWLDCHMFCNGQWINSVPTRYLICF